MLTSKDSRSTVPPPLTVVYFCLSSLVCCICYAKTYTSIWNHRESGEYSFQFSSLERQWKIAIEWGNPNSATFADYEIASLEFLVPIPRPPTSSLENSPKTDMLSPFSLQTLISSPATMDYVNQYLLNSYHMQSLDHLCLSWLPNMSPALTLTFLLRSGPKLLTAFLDIPSRMPHHISKINISPGNRPSSNFTNQLNLS